MPSIIEISISLRTKAGDTKHVIRGKARSKLRFCHRSALCHCCLLQVSPGMSSRGIYSRELRKMCVAGFLVLALTVESEAVSLGTLSSKGSCLSVEKDGLYKNGSCQGWCAFAVCTDRQPLLEPADLLVAMDARREHLRQLSGLLLLPKSAEVACLQRMVKAWPPVSACSYAALSHFEVGHFWEWCMHLTTKLIRLFCFYLLGPSKCGHLQFNHICIFTKFQRRISTLPSTGSGHSDRQRRCAPRHPQGCLARRGCLLSARALPMVSPIGSMQWLID